ncbi:MAG: AsmA-like C-terminal domain-containing protein [Spirochaetes bacterium]|nr:AsmA-like C-terminal domain-containing protein [Spirochaetota bacterium]
MTQGTARPTKRIILYSAFSIFLLLYAATRAIVDFNYLANSAVLKSRLTGYLSARLGSDVTVESLHAVILPHPGIAFTGVYIGRPEGFHAAAEEIALIFSPVSKATGGDWLRRVRLDHVRLSLRIDSLSGRTAFPEFSLPEIELIDPELSIQAGDRTLMLSGPLNGRFRAVSENRLSLFGELECNETELRINGDTITLDGFVLMNGREFSSSGLDIHAGGLLVSARGTYAWETQRVFNGSIAIAGMKIAAKSGGNPVLNAILKNINGAADMTMTDMTLFTIPLDRVTASAVAREGTVILSEVRAEGAHLSGGGTITLAPNRPAAFDVSFTLGNYDLMKLLGQTSSGGTLISGALNLSGRVWGTSASIDGEGQLSSFNGRLMRYGPMFKIFTAANFHKVILKNHPDIKSRGFPYNSIVSDFTIRDSVVSFKHFYLDSDSIQMSASGTYSIPSSTVQALLGFRPLDLLDKTVGMIPVLGWILEGKENAVVVVYLRLHGDINNPKVVPAPVHNAAKGIGGILLRTLMLPYTLVTRPKNLIPALNNNRQTEKENREKKP